MDAASIRLQRPILTPSQITPKSTLDDPVDAESRPQTSANVPRSHACLAQKWSTDGSHDPQLEVGSPDNGATVRFTGWAILGSNQ